MLCFWYSCGRQFEGVNKGNADIRRFKDDCWRTRSKGEFVESYYVPSSLYHVSIIVNT